MTPEDIMRTVDEVERRWRSRTPARSVLDANASYRVAMSETIQWGNQNGIKVDRMDINLQVEMTKMFFRLRREFPNEVWDHLNAATRTLCKRHGIPIPRKSNRGPHANHQ